LHVFLTSVVTYIITALSGTGVNPISEIYMTITLVLLTGINFKICKQGGL